MRFSQEPICTPYFASVVLEIYYRTGFLGLQGKIRLNSAVLQSCNFYNQKACEALDDVVILLSISVSNLSLYLITQTENLLKQS
jgi:hypothetical protein